MEGFDIIRNTLAAGLLVFCAVSANAGVIFDTQALGEPLCGTCLTETRGSFRNYATVLQFSADVTISGFGMFSSVDDAQDVKFLIFDSLLNGGTGAVLFSQTKAFGVTAQTFLYTDSMTFTFQAGRTYDVGILGNGNTLTGRWIAFQDLSSGPILAISRNANIENFGAPTTGSYAGVVPYLQLLDDGAVVPEPATWAMLITGFGLVGAAARRRRTSLPQQA